VGDKGMPGNDRYCAGAARGATGRLA
jgi:hypothetical protein